MVKSSDCLKKYGDPEKQKAMVLWDVPTALEIGVIPKRVYCNKDMVKPLEAAFVIVGTGTDASVNLDPDIRSWSLHNSSLSDP